MAKSSEKKTAAKVKQVTRGNAANKVVAELDGPTSLSELAKKVEEIVVKSGGKANLRSSSDHLKRALQTAEALGVVKLTRPSEILIERAAK